MKVGSGNPSGSIDPRYVSTQGANEARAQDDKGKEAAKVTLSSSAATLKTIHDELAKVPEIRAEKVREIKSEIDAGTYHRPAGKIAEKLILGSLIDSLYQK
ncbi:flagellar biosynthesis anti-sigma factor FlgM [bacterium]|nr:flagellar biosynthesis anti-sigma factor FlgM [bacterium]